MICSVCLGLVSDPVLDAEPGKRQWSAAHQMDLWPPPSSLQPGWLRPVVSSQANIPRGKSGHDDSSSRAWHGSSVTPGMAQSGRGSLALSVDKCLTQEESTGHRVIPDMPGPHPELFRSQKYPDLLQICIVLSSAQVGKQVRDGTSSCSTQVLPGPGSELWLCWKPIGIKGFSRGSAS